MMDVLLPPDVALDFAMALIIASFITSSISAAAGLGGGVAMLAVMALQMPVAALIPVHGVVQLGSNLGRTIVQFKSILWPLVGFFVAGSAVGIVVGSLFMKELPDHWLKLGLVVFIVYMVFAPKPKVKRSGKLGMSLCGVVASSLTMFFGATGVFVAAALLPLNLGKQSHIGTFAACMTMQHGMKIFAFAVLGFAFLPWIPLMAAMIASGFLGTLMGSRILTRIPEESFKAVFKGMMLMLVLRLAWDIFPVIYQQVLAYGA